MHVGWVAHTNALRCHVPGDGDVDDDVDDGGDDVEHLVLGARSFL